MDLLVALICVIAVVVQPNVETARKTVRIQVDPYTTRQIEGVSELDRKKYFNLSDHGVKFDSRVRDKKILKRIVKDLDINFGRSLGPVRSATANGEIVNEDPARPTFANLDEFIAHLKTKREIPSRDMRKWFGNNLGVAAHGAKNAYPEFMGRYFTDQARKDPHAHSIPENIEAAAELAATVFKHRFNDLDRPEFFEPINEPHWSYFNDQKLADWHVATNKAFKANEIPTAVGGSCMSVCYMYNQNYRSWNGFRNFLDNTDGQLDFYSFHVYDYLDFEDGEFVGRIQSGLPLEGVFDLVASYSSQKFGRVTPIVVSEHGGYVSENRGMHPDDITNVIAKEHFPGSGFEWEMEKRSILDFNLVSSILTNTLGFMEHPHIVKKAVPFILLESMWWNPKYYATLYTPYDFKDRKNWVPTCNSHFFEFCRGIKGRRVKLYSSDRDIQLQAFADGRKLHLLINNLWNDSERLEFKIPKASKYMIRRLGRGNDFRPYLTENSVAELEQLQIKGREAVLVTAEYPSVLKEKKVVNEQAYYARRIIKEAKGKSSVKFNVDVDPLKDVDYVMLRIGLRRPPGTDFVANVKLNGKEIKMPMEDCAARLESEKDFATTRIAYVNPKLLKAKNVIAVRFPDGNGGTVGSVVLRVARKITSE